MSASTKKAFHFFKKNPDVSVAQVAKKFKMSPNYAYKIRNTAIGDLVDETIARTLPAHEQETKLRLLNSPSPERDMVNSPKHYTKGGIETIDFIEAKELDYLLGNCVKYISRAELKGSKLENLKKAKWYLDRAISKNAS